MKKLIYKILKEEQDDFDWIREINPSMLVTTDNAFVGARVKINPNPDDYDTPGDLKKYLKQSGGLEGTIISTKLSVNDWSRVKWDNNYINSYQVGAKTIFNNVATYALIFVP
jgi:hypothetical protein